jgi:hypothetical protein
VDGLGNAVTTAVDLCVNGAAAARVVADRLYPEES